MPGAMAETAISIGTKVRITRGRDRIPAGLVASLKSDPIGTVKGYRMTDGTGVGGVVELADGTTSWFFDDEITAA